jgi:hypothetical protein
MTYERPPGAARADFNAAREFENEVGTWLGEFRVGNLTSPDKLDWWVPGVFIDVKEKRQPLTDRWHLLPNVSEKYLFVLDELSVRRAAQYFPHAYFLIRDVPAGGLIYLARIDEVFCAERARLDRVSGAGNRKGKWVIDLRNFRLLTDPANQLLPTVLSDQQHMPWKSSHSVSQLPIPEV